MRYEAIGFVTQAVAALLTRKMNQPEPRETVDGSDGYDMAYRVSTLPPDDERLYGVNGVNLFLYRVSESPYAKNMAWRGDRSSSDGTRRPPLTLTLSYLLTAFTKNTGDVANDDITAHKLLGAAMAILHEYSVLNDIHDSDFDADLDDQFPGLLRNAYEKVKISLSPISVDEVSKIWTGLSKAYRLSVAYEVSLVQIAPVIDTLLPGPPILQTRVQIDTLGAPAIATVEPSVGPVGTLVTLRGSGFKSKGLSTSVSIGDTILTETELARVSDEEIVLRVPEVVQRGPKLPIVVSVGSRRSAPAAYQVYPWISAVRPLRGITGIPLIISLEVPPGANLRVEIDGQTVQAAPIQDNDAIRVIVPTSLGRNGPVPVVVVVGDQASNIRFYEVLPVITTVNTEYFDNPAKTLVTITGYRLDGKNVTIKYGALLLKKGANTQPTDVTFEIPRTLPPDQPVSVLVDGRESNPLPPQLESIEPAAACVDEPITLRGRGLSGQHVSVSFGPFATPAEANAWFSQLNLRVPTDLAAGSLQVTATVDGHQSNPLDFEVLK